MFRDYIFLYNLDEIMIITAGRLHVLGVPMDILMPVVHNTRFCTRIVKINRFIFLVSSQTNYLFLDLKCLRIIDYTIFYNLWL